MRAGRAWEGGGGGEEAGPRNSRAPASPSGARLQFCSEAVAGAPSRRSPLPLPQGRAAPPLVQGARARGGVQPRRRLPRLRRGPPGPGVARAQRGHQRRLPPGAPPHLRPVPLGRDRHRVGPRLALARGRWEGPLHPRVFALSGGGLPPAHALRAPRAAGRGALGGGGGAACGGAGGQAGAVPLHPLPRRRPLRLDLPPPRGRRGRPGGGGGRHGDSGGRRRWGRGGGGRRSGGGGGRRPELELQRRALEAGGKVLLQPGERGRGGLRDLRDCGVTGLQDYGW